MGGCCLIYLSLGSEGGELNIPNRQVKNFEAKPVDSSQPRHPLPLHPQKAAARPSQPRQAILDRQDDRHSRRVQ
jgi:hypothetical protein